MKQETGKCDHKGFVEINRSFTHLPIGRRYIACSECGGFVRWADEPDVPAAAGWHRGKDGLWYGSRDQKAAR